MGFAVQQAVDRGCILCSLVKRGVLTPVTHPVFSTINSWGGEGAPQQMCPLTQGPGCADQTLSRHPLFGSP